jgi:hypothetical protein
MKYAPDMMAFYVPTINSYKRFLVSTCAPTRIAWSYDNRVSCFCVVGRDQSLRIECRIPGADCNIDLAFDVKNCKKCYLIGIDLLVRFVREKTDLWKHLPSILSKKLCEWISLFQKNYFSGWLAHLILVSALCRHFSLFVLMYARDKYSFILLNLFRLNLLWLSLCRRKY